MIRNPDEIDGRPRYLSLMAPGESMNWLERLLWSQKLAGFGIGTALGVGLIGGGAAGLAYWLYQRRMAKKGR
jgi:hypothetical protein